MEKLNIKIRTYTEADRTIIVKFMEQLQDYLVSIDIRKRMRRTSEYGDIYTNDLFRKIKANNGIIYIAECDGKNIGMVAGIIEEQSEVEKAGYYPAKCGDILELFVEEQFRMYGVGKLLISEMEKYFQQNSCNRVSIAVFSLNGAHKFYNKLGYEDRLVYCAKELKERG